MRLFSFEGSGKNQFAPCGAIRGEGQKGALGATRQKHCCLGFSVQTRYRRRALRAGAKYRQASPRSVSENSSSISRISLKRNARVWEFSSHGEDLQELPS